MLRVIAANIIKDVVYIGKKESAAEKGRLFEKRAEEYLIENGYKIIEKNFRSRYGEIDIIALDTDTLVFVEVKGRNSYNYGDGAEAVNAYKRQKIVRCAGDYMYKRRIGPDSVSCRFDVITIHADTICQIKNSFGI